MARSTQSAYNKDERALCFHHELLYEAKVLDSRHSDSTDKKSPMQYRVHYKGWKNTWDDWVPSDRLRKFTDENKELAMQLKKDMESARYQASKDAKKTPSSSKKKAAGSDFSSARGSEERASSLQAQTGPRGQKRGRDFELEKVRLDSLDEHPFEFSTPSAVHNSESGNVSSSFAERSVPSLSPSPNHRRSRSRTASGWRASSKRQEDEDAGRDFNTHGPAGLSARDVYQSSERKSRVPFDFTPITRRMRHTRASKAAAAYHHTSQNENFSLTLSANTQEEHFQTRPSVRVIIPDRLKALLVDDWENVTKNLQLVPLPSKTPVNTILDTYLESERTKRRAGSADADILEEVVQGVKEYFDKCLGRILLYRFERDQFFEVRATWESGVGDWEGKGPGDVYGAEHLCRLFVSMPELIVQTNMDQQSVHRLKEELTKLTAWLAKNSDKYFTSDYEKASHEYTEKAKGV
ncbi:MAG: Esa1p-associated factor [Sclerophora amabilis]|nr:MAG: Esa1p-associated factor [Sclerophora amabilis]